MTRGLTSLEIAGIGLVGSRGAINAGCELTVVTFPFKLFPWGSTAGSHQNDPTFPSRSIEMPAGYGAIHVMTSGIDSWSDGSNKFVMHYHLFCQPTCKSQRPTTPSSSGAKRCVHFHNVTSFLQQICIPVATSSWVPCLALPFAQSNFQFPSQAIITSRRQNYHLPDSIESKQKLDREAPIPLEDIQIRDRSQTKQTRKWYRPS